MIHSSFAVTRGPAAPQTSSAAGYRPGVCNIGPAEIARRRLAGHIGLVATILILAALMALGVPAIVRLVLVVPAALAASGYLQASLKFCAGFGSLGVFNFDAVGVSQPVLDDEARRRDRRRANQIGLASLVIGIAVAFAASLLPL
jgi:ferric-dicitrate binding protein FerR (iron transport regulator)